MYSFLFLSTLVFLKITCCATAIFFLIIIRGRACGCVYASVSVRVCVLSAWSWFWDAVPGRWG